MNKLGIWVIAIAGAFIIGILSANPVVEAVGGWQLAIQGLQAQIDAIPAPESQVYEVSGTTKISAGELSNETITLFCLDGDWRDNIIVDFVTVPPIFMVGVNVHDTNVVSILDPVSETATGVALTKSIGYSVLPELVGGGTPLGFDIDVTVTILCLSPS